jgi:phosphate starvation-inducible PhoH-like protein
MQNATDNQMKMLLTRIGDGSKLVVTGDLNQHDRGYESNGLKMFIDRLVEKGSDRIKLVEFTSHDIERHPVVEEVLRLYGEA